MSPHEILLEGNPHLVSAWEDLCMGWPNAHMIVDALGHHITTRLSVTHRDRRAPILLIAWRRAMASYMVTARSGPDPTQLTEEPLLAFVTEIVASIAYSLADIEIIGPNGRSWTAMGTEPLSAFGGEDPDAFPHRAIKGDLQSLQQHLVKIAVPEEYQLILRALAPKARRRDWLQ